LRQLVSKLPKPDSAEQQYPQRIGGLLVWTGLLGQFAEIAAEKGYRVPPQSRAELDAVVAALGKPALALYDRGRQQAGDRKRELENQAENARKAGNLATATQLLTVERYLLHNYVAFPFDEALRQVADGLDRRVPRY